MNTVVASQLKLTVTFQDHDVDHNHINDDHVHDDDHAHRQRWLNCWNIFLNKILTILPPLKIGEHKYNATWQNINIEFRLELAAQKWHIIQQLILQLHVQSLTKHCLLLYE